MAFDLQQLELIINERASASPQKSYSAQLLHEGIEKCAKKFGEEAVEAVIAAVGGDKKELTEESADVLYHLLVMLKAADIDLSDIMQVLEKRTIQSGLAEKASRK